MSTKRLVNVSRTCLFTVVIVMAAATAAMAGETSWQHDPATPGDWFDPANWSGGVPTGSDNAYIDNGGTAEIGSDIFNSIRAYLGNTGLGSVVHTSGIVSVNSFYLGYSVGGIGLYELSGDATLNSYLNLGIQGSGGFLQTGGTASLTGLRIGYYDTGYGHYLLQSGYLNVSSWDLNVNTNGLFEQTGGASSAGYTNIGYGESGGGTFRLTGGTHSVWGRIQVGREYGKLNTALFELGGTGRLETPALWVGESGLGRFVQTAGECIVQYELKVGTGSYNSTYELHGGLLSAQRIQVGDDYYDHVPGTFVQGGGTLTADKVMLNPSSRFEFTGGQMAFDGGLLNEGTFDFAGGSGTLELAAGSMLDLSKGTIANASNGRINAAANTLVMFPSGFNPATDLADYNSAGVTHTAGTTMVVPADQHLVAFGSIEGHVQCHGSLSVAGSGDSLSITDGLEVMVGGSVDLGRGKLTVENTISTIRGVELKAGSMTVGEVGTGSFDHVAGTVSVGYVLKLGQEGSSEGTYKIAGGDLTAKEAFVGYEGTGHFVHTGGTVRFTCNDSSSLMVGARGGSSGMYELSGTGRLELASTAEIGYLGTGRFVQNGGTVVGFVHVGFASGEGTYELHAGRLEAAWMAIGGNESSSGRGTVVQDGGENIVGSAMGISARGTYVLSGTGRIEADTIGIGWYGPGALFRQEGGTNVVGLLDVAKDHPGTYELSAGVLEAGEVKVSEDGYYMPGPGLMSQTGGTATTDMLTIGSEGRYEFSDGSLQIHTTWVHSGEFDFLSGATGVVVGDDSVVDLRNGSILNAQNASLTVGLKSLTLLPSGFDPHAVFGSFSSLGIVHTEGTTLEIPSGYDLTLATTLNDHVRCQGRLSAPTDRELHLNGGVEVLPGGIVNLEGGDLIVENTISGIDNGQLRANYETVGRDGTGRFVQTGGTNTMDWELRIGHNEGSDGTYELHGDGILDPYKLHIGRDGAGRFIQTGGTNTVGSITYLGYSTGSGAYELQDGRVTAGRIYVGGYGGYGGWDGEGDGHWVQTGGTAECDYLYVLGFGESPSSLELHGGQITVLSDRITGAAPGSAVFKHTGGKYVVKGRGTDWYYGVRLAEESGQYGAYELSGTGQLLAKYVYVGASGEGRFTQTGGYNTVTEKLFVGYWTYATGQYELNDGLLSAKDTYIGYKGVGLMRQSGGNASLGKLYLGYDRSYDEYGDGEYLLSGTGKLSANYEYIGSEGTGAFTQSGGTNVITNALHLAHEAGSAGAYALSGAGFLSAKFEHVGYGGTGVFTQSGGTNTVNQYLCVGYQPGSDGTYTLGGTGGLSAEFEYIGFGGTGVFTQTGGINTVNQDLRLADQSGSYGTYQLSGTGQLSANRGYIGYGGTGTFRQTGGAHTLSLLLGIGGKGTYEMTGGSLATHDLSVTGTLKVIGGSAFVQVQNGLMLQDGCALISEVRGDGISTIEVSGTAVLEGTWTVIDSGAAYGRFDILTAGDGISGSFDSFILPGADWSCGIENDQTLWVEHVPEPAALSLLAVGAVAILKRKSRTRRGGDRSA